MDEPTNDLLKKWNLGHYIQRFEAERIDIAAMQLLSKKDIISLFPQIGDRIRFETCLNMLRMDQPKDNIIMDNTSFIGSSLFDEVLGREFSGSPSTSNIDPLPICDEPNNNQGSLVDNILNSSTEGRQIINIGQKTGALPSDVRTRLCKLLMEKLITAEKPVLQTDSQLLSLSYDIGRLFPKESPPLYYAPYLPADAYQAKRNTSGWLVNARRARRQHLISLGLIEKSRSRSRSKSSPRLDSLKYPGIDLTKLNEGNLSRLVFSLFSN